MAAPEVTVRPLQHPSPISKAISSSIISMKPNFHVTLEFGRSYKRPLPSLLASMASKEDHGATSMRKDGEERSRRGSSVPSLLKAVQEGHGTTAVMQQVSSLRHFFMPELPFAIITEIKKRMPLSFREDDQDNTHELSGGLIVEEELEAQLTVMGPRCAWPRAKLASTEEWRDADMRPIQGPRCAWPRGSMHALDCLQQPKQGEDVLASNEEVASDAKYALPRASSRTAHQIGPQESVTSSLMSAQLEDNTMSIKSSIEVPIILSGDLDKLKGVTKRSEESNSRVIGGPRCAWPRTTPRRMIATGVGLGLMNYLLIDQGVPALAILLQSPIPIRTITCDGEDLDPQKSLLP